MAIIIDQYGPIFMIYHNMFKYYTDNMAIIIDQYGPIFMIYHTMCNGCMDRRMDVHTDRRMSGRTDEITCVTLYYPIILE